MKYYILLILSLFFIETHAAPSQRALDVRSPQAGKAQKAAPGSAVRRSSVPDEGPRRIRKRNPDDVPAMNNHPSARKKGMKRGMGRKMRRGGGKKRRMEDGRNPEAKKFL